jgi:hypothetical protein
VNPAVRRLLDQREDEGFDRHVTDDGVLAQVAHLLDANDAGRDNGAPKKGAAANLYTPDPSKIDAQTRR